MTHRRAFLPVVLFGALCASVAVGQPTAPAPDSAIPNPQTYPWLASWPEPLPPSVPLAARFKTPPGFTRVEVLAGSYAAWLRELPIRTDRTSVLAHDGRPLHRPAAAIALLDVGERDLQQCADTAIRLHAEYLWSVGLGERAAYHFTSGDRSAWRDWRGGERFKVKGARVERVRGRSTANDHRAYRAWLQFLFTYAGTQSLRLDSDPVGARPIEGGDFYVAPGSPGHAVVILDVAVDESGRRAALIGQGFMPAEDLHVLTSSGPRMVDKHWFLLPDADHKTLSTPSWAPFNADHARRFRTPAK